MNWSLRHEGSPQSINNLTLQQVLQGLADGNWEATDEVKGPDDKAWIAIENHPALEEAAAELEAPPQSPHDDETRLDLTALIDVTMVLLIFFILTTTVAALQKRLEAPTASNEKDKGVAKVTEKEVQEQMIHVKATMEGGQPVVRIENTVIDPVRMMREFTAYVRSSKKTTLLLEHDDNVPQDLVVKIIDAAKGAGMDRVRLLVP